MGRQVRMVPKDWKHPKTAEGKYIPLLQGSFVQADADWNEGYAAWQRDVQTRLGDERCDGERSDDVRRGGPALPTGHGGHTA